MDKTLSIIIPAYNISSTMDQLLESILDSKLEDIEIIIVNDGSLDNTPEKAERYHSMYPNVVFAVDKENGGHGSAINTGVKHITGKYFQIIDGDDWVVSNNLRELVQILRGVDCDLILFPHIDHYIHTNVENIIPVIKNSSIVYNTIYQFEQILPAIDGFGMNSIIYNTQVYRGSDIYIDEHIFYDDNEFATFPLPHINTVLFFEDPIYVYRLGQANQSVNSSNLWKRRDDYKRVLMHLLQYYDSIEKNTNLERYMKRYVSSTLLNYYIILLNYCDDDQLAQQEFSLFDTYLRNKYVSFYSQMKSRRIRALRITHYHLFSIIRRVRLG